MYLKLQEKEKAAMEMMQTKRNNLAREKQEKTQQHDERFHPAVYNQPDPRIAALRFKIILSISFLL
jgi:hypothetical protein